MKKVLISLLVLAALGSLLVACHNPIDGIGGAASRAVTLSDGDKAFAAVLTPTVSARTNASGKDISSNGQGAAVPGMFFYWDPSQKDNAYLKVKATLLYQYESFVLTTKEANKYWDFLITPVADQIITDDGYYVFYIPKQEKNINGVWISGYADNSKISELEAYVDELYGDKHDFSSTSRANKMRALVLEIALRAKSQNPAFNIIPQDTLSLAYVNGATNQGIDYKFMSMIDGWGIESNSDSTLNTMRDLKAAGMKMATTTSNSTTAAALADNLTRADARGVLYFPRLGTDVYMAAGLPYVGSNGSYVHVENPVAAGKACAPGEANPADCIGCGFDHAGTRNVYSLKDAKNYLYMINPNNWSREEVREASSSLATGLALILPVPAGYVGGSRVTAAAYVTEMNRPSNAALFPDGADTLWDYFWRVQGRSAADARAGYIADLKASNWDVIYIDAHFSKYNNDPNLFGGDYPNGHPSDMSPQRPADIDKLKYKLNGGRRQVISYLSIGTAESYRWWCEPSWILPARFDTGMVSGGVWTPSPNVENNGAWKIAVIPAYSAGQYDNEAAVIYWHDEWRDMMVRGGSSYKNPQYEHSYWLSQLGYDNPSSIDRIVFQHFDGVYLDNVSRYPLSGYTQVGQFDAANPDYFWN